MTDVDALAMDAGGQTPSASIAERVSQAYAADFHRLVGLAVLLTGDAAAAEDVVHDAFEVAMRRAAVDPSCVDAPVTPWLRGIVAKVVQQRRRGLLREMRRLMRVYQRPSEQTGLTEESLDMVAALLRLPPRMRTCTVLFYIGDQSTADIARALQCSPRTVENHLRAARERLRRDLADDGAEPFTPTERGGDDDG